MVKMYKISRLITFEHTGTMALVLEHLLCVHEIVGLIPDEIILKALKMELAALSLAAQH